LKTVNLQWLKKKGYENSKIKSSLSKHLRAREGEIPSSPFYFKELREL
jgi:hypothetical protein